MRLPATLRNPVVHWAAALTVVVYATLAALWAQPLTSPWWWYADADGSYVGSAANVMAGHPSFYLDHPGLPLEELMAATYEVDYAIDKLGGSDKTREEYAGERLRDLNSSRPFYRTYGAIFYLIGALVSFLVAARWFRRPGWAMLAGLLWLAAPELLLLSIQFRPDVLLSALCLLVAALMSRGVVRRSPAAYLGAAMLLGFTVTVKMHAAALAIPLLLAAVLWPPGEGWGAEVRRRLRARRWLLAALAAPLILFAIVFNRQHWPFDISSDRWHFFYELLAGFAAAIAACLLVPRIGALGRLRRVLNPFTAAMAAALLAGLLIPCLIVFEDGLVALTHIRDGFLGGGVNDNVAPFSIEWARFFRMPLEQTLVLFSLAGVSAVVALRKRDPLPGLWFLGAAGMAVLATARLATVHYYAPTYVLCVPPVIWLLLRLGRFAPIAGVALAVFMLQPHLNEFRDSRTQADASAARATEIVALGDELAGDGQVVILGVTQSGDLIPNVNFPLGDTRFFYVVQWLVQWNGDYRYRFLPDAPNAYELIHDDGLSMRYYVGRIDGLPESGAWRDLGLGHRYFVRPLPQYDDRIANIQVAQMLKGEGVDRPFDHPDAAYDPWTGYYKEAGRYFDLRGSEVQSPPRREYDAVRKLWRDAQGVSWNAQGQVVLSP